LKVLLRLVAVRAVSAIASTAQELKQSVDSCVILQARTKDIGDVHDFAACNSHDELLLIFDGLHFPQNGARVV
jgi:hypothetical protein